MPLTVKKALDYMTHALGGEPDDRLDKEDLLNQVGNLFFSSHSWGFLERRVQRLAARAAVSVTGATYSHSAKTFTKVGGFASYELVAGDFVTVSDSSGVSLAQLDIASKTDDVLTVQSVTNALAVQDTNALDLAIDTSRLELPSDWGGTLELTASEQFSRALVKTTPDELINLRTTSLGWSGFETWAALFGAKLGAELAPETVLEIWPAPNEDDWDAFSINYRARWVDVDGPDAQVPIPDYAIPAFLSMLRAYARGMEEEEGTGMDVDDRIVKVLSGPVWALAMQHDERREWNFGAMQNTAWDQAEGHSINHSQALIWASDPVTIT